MREIGAGLPQGSSALVVIAPENGLTGLQSMPGLENSRMTVEPIVLDLDAARQLTEGQYGEALGSLATQAEGLIGEAKGRVTEMAGAATEKAESAVTDRSEVPAPSEGADVPVDYGPEETGDQARA